MARPIKDGLNYFPLDVDIFDDPKLLFIEDRFGVKGELVTIKLLCWIYRNGYKCEWNNEHAMIFAKKNFSSIKATLCTEIVNELLKRGFFNEALFKSFGVLTSKSIQQRWFNAITNAKRKSKLIPELNLLLTEETTPKQELTIAEREESTRSKENRIELNNIKDVYTGFVEEIGKNEHAIFREGFYLKFKIRKGSLSKLLKEFSVHLLTTESNHTELKKFKEHFTNWMNTQETLGKLNDYKTKRTNAL
jgi:hypothetical protein